MPQFVKAAHIHQIAPGTMRAVEVEGRRILLVDLGGEVHALDTRCPHRGGPMDEGELWQGTIECPWHHYRYDVRTGVNLYPGNVYPADLPFLQRDLGAVRRYAVQIRGEEVWVEL